MTTGMGQLLYKVRWQLRMVQPGKGKALEPGEANPEGDEVSECDIIDQITEIIDSCGLGWKGP